MLSPIPKSVTLVEDSAVQAGASARAHRWPRRRVEIDGRLFRVGGIDWYLKGFTYGPFRPNSQGDHLPEREQFLGDLVKMRELGCNAIRLYHRPHRRIL